MSRRVNAIPGISSIILPTNSSSKSFTGKIGDQYIGANRWLRSFNRKASGDGGIITGRIADDINTITAIGQAVKHTSGIAGDYNMPWVSI